jgi:hypothetical protein
VHQLCLDTYLRTAGLTMSAYFAVHSWCRLQSLQASLAATSQLPLSTATVVHHATQLMILTAIFVPFVTTVSAFTAVQRVRSSIARLGFTSIDLLQLHWEPPVQPAAAAAAGSRDSSSKGQPPPPGFVTAAKVLSQLQQEGVIKQFGVSNFDVPMLLALLDAGVKPVSNQVGGSAKAWGGGLGGGVRRGRRWPADMSLLRCCCRAMCVPAAHIFQLWFSTPRMLHRLSVAW